MSLYTCVLSIHYRLLCLLVCASWDIHKHRADRGTLLVYTSQGIYSTGQTGAGCLCIPVRAFTAQGTQGQVEDIRERCLIGGNECR